MEWFKYLSQLYEEVKIVDVQGFVHNSKSWTHQAGVTKLARQTVQLVAFDEPGA